MNRDLRRLRLLVTRAAADCGRWHPELRELDALLRVDRIDSDRVQSLLAALERPVPADPDREECRIIRGDIASELRDLIAHGLALAR